MNSNVIEMKKDENTGAGSKEVLTINIAGQKFGVPVLEVEDVLGPQKVTKIPLAPPEVAGSLNLRGRIVTAIDVRCSLGMERREIADKQMSVVVEHKDELYSLVIDSVGDVLNLKDSDFEKNPATLDALWRDISVGIYRLEDELLVILDIPKLICAVNT